MKTVLILLTLLSAGATAADAAPRCIAKVTKDVAARENPAAVMHRGKTFGPVTQLSLDPGTGETAYCSHGGNCYPSGSLDIVSPCTFYGDRDSRPTGEPGDEVILYAK
jgi:hypothetical protein